MQFMLSSVQVDLIIDVESILMVWSVCGLCPLIVGHTSQAGAIFTPWYINPVVRKFPASLRRTAVSALLNSYSVRIEILFHVGKKITQGRVSVNIQIVDMAEWIIRFSAPKKKNTQEFPLRFCFLFVFLPSFLFFSFSSVSHSFTFESCLSWMSLLSLRKELKINYIHTIYLYFSVTCLSDVFYCSFSGIKLFSSIRHVI